MKCDILNISKMVHCCFFCIPKKLLRSPGKSHFFLPNSGLPHRKAARHISGPGFGGGWTDKEAISY